MLLDLSFPLGGTKPTPTITVPGGSVIHGVQGGTFLPLCHLYIELPEFEAAQQH